MYDLPATIPRGCLVAPSVAGPGMVEEHQAHHTEAQETSGHGGGEPEGMSPEYTTILPPTIVSLWCPVSSRYILYNTEYTGRLKKTRFSVSLALRPESKLLATYYEFLF